MKLEGWKAKVVLTAAILQLASVTLSVILMIALSFIR